MALKKITISAPQRLCARKNNLMALHPHFPESPYSILDPGIRWFPVDEMNLVLRRKRRCPPKEGGHPLQSTIINRQRLFFQFHGNRDRSRNCIEDRGIGGSQFAELFHLFLGHVPNKW